MKRLAVILAILILLVSACAAPVVKPEQSAEALIKALIQTKVESVKTTDAAELLSIIDPEDKELQTEQTNWLADIKINPIERYSLDILNLEQTNDGVYKAKLLQQYAKGGKNYKLDFYNKYKIINGKAYDVGNYFDELKQGNIIIKYTTANKKLAEDVIGDMNQLYDANIKRWGITPKRPMVIKLFDDIEELRQSIKFSMWQCAGWYEYGESVKMLMNKSMANEERIKQVVNHEMTHLFTVEKSSGNLAYWFSEGIASYYETQQSQKNPRQLMREANVKLLTIDELEAMELEKLEDPQQINEYYRNSQLITAFIIEKYGEEKLLKILQELGKLPALKGTTSENDKSYREYLSEVLPKVLEIKDYDTFKKLWQSEINKLTMG